MSPSIALVLSVFALAAGPLVAGLLHRQARLHALLDGFILVMVAGLAVLHLLPHAYEVLGPLALLLRSPASPSPIWSSVDCTDVTARSRPPSSSSLRVA